MRERDIHLLVGSHEGTSPSSSLGKCEAQLDSIAIPEKEWELPKTIEPSSIDAFVLLVDARSGISAGMIRCWQFFAERQYPRLLLVQGIEFAESDFDDIVLIANRVLEEFATPYLVLHDDLGQPSGLIELRTNTVTDYSGSGIVEYTADTDLQNLVSEFKHEQDEIEIEISEGAFLEGTRAIALPIGEVKPIGLRELNLIIKPLAKQ